jgi:hypothetical protein
VVALPEFAPPAVTLLGSTLVMSVVTALGFELAAVLELVLVALLLEIFVSGACVLGVVALGAFVFGVGTLEVGLSAGMVAVVAGALVSGVLPVVPLDVELTGFGVVFVALKLGVPRKSRETKPPTTSKIREIIKVSTQFRRHQPIGFMALLYPLSM